MEININVLKNSLIGKVLTFFDLDNIMTKNGCPSEMDWVDDWEEIANDGVTYFQFPPVSESETSGKHIVIKFDVEDMYNPEEEASDQILINIKSVA